MPSRTKEEVQEVIARAVQELGRQPYLREVGERLGGVTRERARQLCVQFGIERPREPTQREKRLARNREVRNARARTRADAVQHVMSGMSRREAADLAGVPLVVLHSLLSCLGMSDASVGAPRLFDREAAVRLLSQGESVTEVAAKLSASVTVISFMRGTMRVRAELERRGVKLP